jgi:hypothetical protein
MSTMIGASLESEFHGLVLETLEPYGPTEFHMLSCDTEEP